MKILFYSDIHLRDRGSFLPYTKVESNGLSKELNNIIKGFTFVQDKINEINPDMVIFTGDLYHYPEQVSTSCLYASHIGLSMIKKSCNNIGIPHYLIPGQHDIIDEINMITSIITLNGYGNIILNSQLISYKDIDIAFIPYSSNSSKLYVDFLNYQDKANLIVCHTDFSGCIYENKQKSNSVLNPDLKCKVISGDIHIPQDIGSVSYVGSLIQNKFFTSNLNNIGGVLVYDTNTKEVKRYPNIYSKHYVKIYPKSMDDKEYLEKALNFDKSKVILSIYSFESKDTIDKMFDGYDYYYWMLSKEQIFEKYDNSNFILDNPEILLKSHVQKENPDAIKLLEEILK